MLLLCPSIHATSCNGSIELIKYPRRIKKKKKKVTPATKTETADKVIEEAALNFPVVALLPVVLEPVVALLPVVLDAVVEIVEVMVMVGRLFDGEMDRPVVMKEAAGAAELEAVATMLLGCAEGVVEIDCTHGLVALPYSTINPATSTSGPLIHSLKEYWIVLFIRKLEGKPERKKQTACWHTKEELKIAWPFSGPSAHM